MNLAKSYEFFQPEKLGCRIHIIGCGSVGSTVAENLARFGITDITLYDFDVVEPHNIVNQMFRESDVGRLKTEALADMLYEINPACKGKLKLVNTGWTGQRLAGHVFLCVDNIELRKEIATKNTRNSFIKGMYDFRTRLTDAQHYAADWSNKKMVESFIASMDFTHDEATKETPLSACRIPLSVAPTIRMVVACGVANFVNFVTGNNNLKKLILVDAFGFTVDAF